MHSVTPYRSAAGTMRLRPVTQLAMASPSDIPPRLPLKHTMLGTPKTLMAWRLSMRVIAASERANCGQDGGHYCGHNYVGNHYSSMSAFIPTPSAAFLSAFLLASMPV